MTIEIGKMPSYVSYTSFTGYLRCPKSWQLKRIVKLSEQPSWWSVGGKAVHAATETYDRRPEGFDAEVEWQKAWEKEVADQLEDVGDEFPMELWRAGGRRSKEYPNKEDGAWWQAHGQEMVEGYIKWREQTAWPLYEVIPGVTAIETELLAVFGDIPVKMYLDRVFVPDGMLTVVDLKSGSRVPDSALQLGVYAAGLEYVFGERPAYGCYFMTRKAQTTEAVELDRYSIPLLGKWLQQFKNAVDAQAFPPNVGMACSTCGVARGCLAKGGADAAMYDPDAQETK